MTTIPPLETLDHEQRGQLEAWLVDFDCHWAPGQLRARLPLLPAEALWRRHALVEMVKIDLERRWQAGERPGLADYLRDVPELGTPRTVPADLVQAEHDVRQQFGERLDTLAFLEPYGDRAEELAALLAGGSVPAEPAGPLVGLPAVPGYEVLGELGRGGMGIVYRARQESLGRVVALKMLLHGGHADPEELARFRREAETLARLNHPNVVQIYEVGEQGGRPYFAMEFCEAGSLSAALAGRPQPVRQAAELVATLARAVQAAHEAGVVHRDLNADFHVAQGPHILRCPSPYFQVKCRGPV
jgi:hypothetical protein